MRHHPFDDFWRDYTPRRTSAQCRAEHQNHLNDLIEIIQNSLNDLYSPDYLCSDLLLNKILEYNQGEKHYFYIIRNLDHLLKICGYKRLFGANSKNAQKGYYCIGDKKFKIYAKCILPRATWLNALKTLHLRKCTTKKALKSTCYKRHLAQCLRK